MAYGLRAPMASGRAGLRRLKKIRRPNLDGSEDWLLIDEGDGKVLAVVTWTRFRGGGWAVFAGETEVHQFVPTRNLENALALARRAIGAP